MKKSTQILTLALVPISLCCLAGATFELRNINADKSYWENKGETSKSDLLTLENGLKTLKDNEKAYYDGKITYENGLKEYEQGKHDLEQGQKEYADGLVLLAEKQQEYDDGVVLLNQKQQEYDQGLATLTAKQQEYDDSVALLAQKQSEYDQGLADLQAAEVKLAQGKAELDANRQRYIDGKATIEASAPLLESGKALLASVTPLAESTKEFNANYAIWLADFDKLQTFRKSYNEKIKSDPSHRQSLPDASISNTDQFNEAITFATTLGLDTSQVKNLPNSMKNLTETIIAGLQDFTAKVNAMPNLFNQLSQIEGLDPKQISALSSNLKTLNTMLPLFGTPTTSYSTQKGMLFSAVKGGGETLLSVYDQASKILATKQAEFDAGKAELAKYEAGQAEYEAGLIAYNAGKQQLADGAIALAAGRQQLAEAAPQLAAGKQQLENGATQLAEGKQQLADGAIALNNGKAELAEGKAEIEIGEQKLEAAEQQLADGKAKLQEFEDGRDQAIAGLQTAIATETYGNLQSIKNRLGENFTYADENGNLNLDQGFAAVTTAREFLDDNTAAVTSDLTHRLISAIAIIALGVAALALSLLLWRRPDTLRATRAKLTQALNRP